MVALKCGRDGVRVSDGRRRERIAGHAVAMVDATGAGDCFDGAFAARTLAGAPLAYGLCRPPWGGRG